MAIRISRAAPGTPDATFRAAAGAARDHAADAVPDVLIASGAGVGGGSLGYANTLYRARDSFFEDPRWRELADWKAELAAHYDTAERMLGVTRRDLRLSDGDILLRELAGALGVEDTYGHTRVGVYLGEPGVEHPDPYFDGDGPARTGCMRCGECMVGCRHGAKNTLVKNYLWFAERLGVRIDAERTVTDVRPLGAADGADGYAVTHVPSGALRRGRGERSPPAASCSPRVRWAPTGCSPAAGIPVRCRASPIGSAPGAHQQ